MSTPGAATKPEKRGQEPGRAALRASDVMTPEPVCVNPSTTIRQLARVFEEHDVSGVPVVDSRGRAVGVVSKSDLIRRCSEGTPDLPPGYLFELISDEPPSDETLIPESLVCVEDFMTAPPVTVTGAARVPELARLMEERRIHRVIVTDAERVPIGIITSLDLLGVWPAAGPPVQELGGAQGSSQSRG